VIGGSQSALKNAMKNALNLYSVLKGDEKCIENHCIVEQIDG
jgi:hypothetical protein